LERSETERLRAEQAVYRSASQLDALRHLGEDLCAPREHGHFLHCILSRAVELAGGTAGELYGYNARRDVLESAAVTGPDLPPIGSVVRRGEGLAGRVWESGDSVIVEDYDHWDARTPLDQQSPRTAAVGVPLRHADRFAGVLSVLLDSEEDFSQADTELLRFLASPAALIIENTGLVEDQRRRLRQAETITQVGRAITAILDVDALLSQVVDLIADRFGYYFVHVFEE